MGLVGTLLCTHSCSALCVNSQYMFIRIDLVCGEEQSRDYTKVCFKEFVLTLYYLSNAFRRLLYIPAEQQKVSEMLDHDCGPDKLC